ncbi:hypothetical protein NliqN6_3894 [Naganishia liquefaciens]|uniref:Uncharacterized protein n=1 Tax=Naganishia liquefaciens TaxID=104408 RepID=A0A8H3YGR9_9TREE|nr:hypothetical protein NliqN6_3894 [Naganishia liquefaciens]
MCFCLSSLIPLFASASPADSATPSIHLERRLFDSDDSATSSASRSKRTSAAGTAQEIIDFMQVIMQGGIHWITLVNATQSELGTCLGLSTLSTLVVQGSNYSFASAVDNYLTDICSGAKCTSASLKYWKYKLNQDCAAGSDLQQPLLRTLDVVMGNYETSLYDLACKVHYNGTAPYCLSEVLNATQTTNSKDFFTNILTGTNINWYEQSFFGQQICTGCMHELYKAAMFLIPSIRSLEEMTGLGVTLSTCQSNGIAWNDICDMAKPDALSVVAATAQGQVTSAASSFRVDSFAAATSLFSAAVWLLL